MHNVITIILDDFLSLTKHIHRYHFREACQNQGSYCIHQKLLLCFQKMFHTRISISQLLVGREFPLAQGDRERYTMQIHTYNVIYVLWKCLITTYICEWCLVCVYTASKRAFLWKVTCQYTRIPVDPMYIYM